MKSIRIYGEDARAVKENQIFYAVEVDIEQGDCKELKPLPAQDVKKQLELLNLILSAVLVNGSVTKDQIRILKTVIGL